MRNTCKVTCCGETAVFIPTQGQQGGGHLLHGAKRGGGQFHLVTLLQTAQGSANGWCFLCTIFTRKLYLVNLNN